jgi:hypothetical protein
VPSRVGIGVVGAGSIGIRGALAHAAQGAIGASTLRRSIDGQARP